MLTQVTGVLVDGSVNTGLAPADPRQQINVAKYETLVVRATIIRSNGVPVDLTGKTVVMNVKRRSTDSINVIRKVGTRPASTPNNVVEFSIAPVDTRIAVLGRYVYTITVIDGSTRDVVIPLSPFVIEAGLEPV